MAVAAPRRHRPPTPRLRILTAVPLCDGHDSAIMTINRELVSRGAEVVYLGYHQSVSAIVRAAIQEDVHAVGISSYNGGHLVFFRELLSLLRRRGVADIRVFGGGGGTITPADERVMRRFGVERIFFAGTPLETVAREVLAFARPLSVARSLAGDRRIARAITLAEQQAGAIAPPVRSGRRSARAAAPASNSSTPFVIGVAGPGGAGKSTLIDELTSRFLRRHAGRIAILANDPSHASAGGAMLGDRVSAIYAQDDRVFFRSLATRGSLTGVSSATPAAIETLRRTGGFDLIIVESVGIGQESDPFGALGRGQAMVDATLFVTSPHYGGRIQLEKIALLSGADAVVLNKCDDPRAGTAKTEITSLFGALKQRPPLHLTTASRHNDAGVDHLYSALEEIAGFSGTGGERPCQLQIHA